MTSLDEFQGQWILYVLLSQDGQRSYCGISNQFKTRFRRHVGLIKGGARYTSIMKGATNDQELPQIPICVVTGWFSETAVRSFEHLMHGRVPKSKRDLWPPWKARFLHEFPDMKGRLNRRGGIQYRLIKLLHFLELDQGKKETSLLHIYWYQDEYRHPLWDQRPEKIKQTVLTQDVFETILREYREKGPRYAYRKKTQSSTQKGKKRKRPASTQEKTHLNKKLKKKIVRWKTPLTDSV